MPRPTRANGRPGTAVIPPGWGASHATVAAGTMNARVSLRVPGTSVRWNEERKRSESTPNQPFATNVPARVQAVRESLAGGRAAVDAAEDQVRVTGYLVSIPLNVRGGEQVANGVLVEVASSSDPLLAGRTLRVTDEVLGSDRFERDLLCSLNT